MSVEPTPTTLYCPRCGQLLVTEAPDGPRRERIIYCRDYDCGFWTIMALDSFRIARLLPNLPADLVHGGSDTTRLST